jgi:O-6-methylguanine DNA methyltransferase
MKKKGHTLFETVIGCCGLAWNEVGIVKVQLPENSKEATLTALKIGCEDFPYIPIVERAIKKVQKNIAFLLSGQSFDLPISNLDLSSVTSFRRRVYLQANKITPGSTISYGQLAKAIGAPNSSRAVGQALGANPFPLLIPCHRIIAANGDLRGFSAAGGLALKRYLIAVEKMPMKENLRFLYDPRKAVDYLREVDPYIAKAIDRVGEPSIVLREEATVYFSLVRAIVSQQLSVKAAGTIFKRLCDRFKAYSKGLCAQNFLLISHQELRECGLSRNKVLSIHDLSERTISGEIPTLTKLRKMSDYEIIESLTCIRGIGKWTVEMLLIFHLGRPDVLAVDDLGLRLGHACMLGGQGETSRKELEEYGQLWRPYRSVASWYLWRLLDLSRSDKKTSLNPYN